SLNLSGSYRQLLTFLKRVGEMPRIVDVKNLKLEPAKDGDLKISGQAVTYRFIESEPKQGQAKNAPARR
ncbi:MAG TPA: type 4a pilus biogenesis protein PilO, partial [Mariprofundaceae bacterium]|nr:type 4a pilus biogenesis protein PilO [Mariprofundaceae bacterium]